MLKRTEQPKFPYTFNSLQIDTLARTVGNATWYQNEGLKGVNLEIGIAKTREALSTVKGKVDTLMGRSKGASVTLYLTDGEVDALLEIVDDDTIRRILSE